MTYQKVKIDRRKGDNHWNWKGNNANYIALHKWLRKNKPKPEKCERCGIYTSELDCSNISGKLTRTLDDYEYICKSCHSKKDNWIEHINKMKGVIS